MKVSKKALQGLAVVGCLFGAGAFGAGVPTIDLAALGANEKNTLLQIQGNIANKDQILVQQADLHNRVYGLQVAADKNRADEASKQLAKIAQVWSDGNPLNTLRAVLQTIGSPDVMSLFGDYARDQPLKDKNGLIMRDQYGNMMFEASPFTVLKDSLTAGFEVAKAMNGQNWKTGTGSSIATVTNTPPGTPTNAAVAAAMQVDVQAALAKSASANALDAKTAEIGKSLAALQNLISNPDPKKPTDTKVLMEVTVASSIMQGQLQALGNAAATLALRTQAEASVNSARNMVVSQQLAKNTNGKLLAGW